MKKTLAALVLVALGSLSVRAEILEQVIVKVNGDIITKTELEARQVAAIRQRNRTNVTAEDLRNDAELKKVLDEITPQLVVDAVDELLVMQRGKELGYRMGDEQFTQILANIRKENKLEDEGGLRSGAQAGRPDDGRTAEVARAPDDHVARAAGRGVRPHRDHRGRVAHLLQRAPNEFSTPSSITIREITIDVPTRGARRRRERAADVQRAARRRGEGQGRVTAQARAGRRRLRGAGDRGVRLGVEGQRRPDRSAEQRRAQPADQGRSSMR